MLLSTGADSTIKNKNRETAADRIKANDENRIRILQLLENKQTSTQGINNVVCVHRHIVVKLFGPLTRVHFTYYSSYMIEISYERDYIFL